jgi:putative copper export protein
MDYHGFLLMIHALGLAWGVGGATVNTILVMKADKNPEIAPVVMSLVPSVAKLIWVAIMLLIVSGLGLSLELADYFDSQVLLVKHVIIAVMVVIGLVMIVVFMPKMQQMAPKGGPPSAEFLALKKKVQAMGMLNFFLWYAIFVMSFWI